MTTIHNLTTDQRASVAGLIAACRPHGARRWDRGEIIAALGKLEALALPDVLLAMVRAADDRDCQSPFAVTNTTSPHWRERATDRPEPSVRSVGPWCVTCGNRQTDHANADHPFQPRTQRPDGAQVRRIVQALKAEIQPTNQPEGSTTR